MRGLLVALAASLPLNLWAAPPISSTTRGLCTGAYANSLSAVSRVARQRESRARYTFCIRSRATYQCPYYGTDGKLRSRHATVTRHGTAFAFRRDGKKTYLMSNEHVVEWPAVTTSSETVDDVPTGCRRTRQISSIVDKESDSYAKDDVPLQKVAVDAALDAAILKGPVAVVDIPFVLGQSAAIETRDAVQVRGFPLGAFQALTTGKVINPRARDSEQGWAHTDLVIDAQLSSGSSGSPVLAVSCKTGQLELVGVYHAAYRDGQGLNVAVGVDDLRQLMTTLKASRRALATPLSRAERVTLMAAMTRKAFLPLMPFGSYVLRLRREKVRLYFDLFSKRFPLEEARTLTVEDLPAAGFGRIGRLWFGRPEGPREVGFSSLSVAQQHLVTQIVDAFRRQSLRVLRYRRARGRSGKTRQDYERWRALSAEIDRAQARQSALIKRLNELRSQLSGKKER